MTSEAIVDLKKVQPVHYVGVQVFQFWGPSILYPRQLQVSGSVDGKTYFPLANAENTRVPTSNKEEMQLLGATLQGQARYLRVKATNGGKLPSGGPSRIFISEVVVR